MFTDYQTWSLQMMAQGRVAGGIRMPPTVSSVTAGQLASRLAVPNPALGSGPAQWDYQLAPLFLRVEDNAGTLGDMVTMDAAWVSQNLDSIRQYFGDAFATAVQNTVSMAANTVGDVAGGVAKGLGVTGWIIVGVLGVGALVYFGAPIRRIRSAVT